MPRLKTFVILLVILPCILSQQYQDLSYQPDFLDMDPDSILEENAIITANATCGTNRREYFCRLVEHADGALLYKRDRRQVETYTREEKSYRDPYGQWIQCSFCDARDPRLSHPIEYVLRGESDLWWQSPSLAEGLKYHAVTITMDFNQIYQIVYVLLRMGDSPRPANWILERSVDGVNYKPWVFFAESEYDCKRLYEPLINGPLTVTSGPRPWKLEDDEVYCTTFYSQPQALQSGEIIVTLTLDRESTISGTASIERAISPKLIDFLSARYVRLRFQKLQTLSGDWMAMPNQLDSSVYNRYYYSIRTIKVGGKCLCNSHANRCEQAVVDGVPRAVCLCQHNTCGSNCEICCPLFNQQIWRPGRVCEECNCNGKADSCVYNQTVANMRLSMRKDGVYEGGGVCVNCREDTTGINCEKCKPGFYRPINVRPESPFPCVKCKCDSYGSTGECVTNDAEVPDRYPGDCICKEGFAGKLCDQCAEGYRRSTSDSRRCVPCTCDVRGSHRGGGYQCEPPCNCKVNVNPESNCRQCQPGHFNLDANNPEGCQACYCSGLTDQCNGVSPTTAMILERNGQLGTVSTLHDWHIIIPSAPADSGYTVPSTGRRDEEQDVPISADIRTVEAWLSSVTLRPVDRGYYWSAPKAYLGNQITAYRGSLMIILRLHSPTLISFFGSGPPDPARRGSSAASLVVRDRLQHLWLNEPDIVLEGNGYRLAHILPATYRDNHMIIQLPLHESAFRVLIEPPSSVPLDKVPIGLAQGSQPRSLGYDDAADEYERIGRPATVADLITVLSNLERLLIKTKYISDQSMIELRLVKMERATRDPSGGIPSLEECVCPPGHTGTSCESCAPGYWRNPFAQQNETSAVDRPGAVRAMWRSTRVQPTCVPCQCHGHSSRCDQKTGKCIDCQHHTSGDKCDQCAPGYYGDPRSGSPTACKPCECPSLSNQKTQSCVAHDRDQQSAELEQEEKPYVCLDCEENTRGRYCELCAEGYYGQPLRGVACRKCDCGRGAIGCNSTTGACICGFNTAGPRCDSCAEGTHGDPMLGQACRPCNCHEKGSVSPTCRAGDGQCTCHPGYEGVRCERCVVGRGNVDEGCPPCKCHHLGTRPSIHPPCDPVSGQCPCKPGIGGTLDCSQCQPGYFNLGPNGCQECECSNRAVDRVCDPITGRCNCGANVIGPGCDKCQSGHYWNVTGPNCLPCDCGLGTQLSATLSMAASCNMETGQCECAPHVTGRQCTECEPGFFGVSPSGCQPCPMCPNGQVCDQITGKCICPPHTQGDRCEECAPGSYDYNPITGCKPCNCSSRGAALATLDTCDLVSGQCVCEPGYAGRACDQCEAGHYGYPNCRPCDCDPQGTQRQNDTSQAIVACNQDDGSCICKPNVEGPRCDQCKPGTFGLSVDYPLGCYSCFCFPTSAPPKCSLLTGYRSVPGKQRGVDIIASDRESVPGGALIQLSIGLGPDATTDLSIGVNQFDWRFSTHRPTFMEIPELKGSLMRNYGSEVIAVSTECLRTGDCRLNAPSPQYPMEMMTTGPSVNRDEAGGFIVRLPYRIDAKMTALNGTLELEYQPADDIQTTMVDGFRHIWLRESDWVLTKVVGRDTRVRPSRNELMLALLNVTSFSVRLFMPEANPKMVSVRYRIYEALTETTTVSGTPIRSIEKCECPTTASGDHCEVASPGFYFPQLIPKPGPSILPPTPGVDPPKQPENIIWSGGVEKCRCHGMSSHCDPVTGVCEACTGNTMGPDCGQCATGYMGDPTKGQPCVKCQCPTEQTDYAITCIPTPNRPYVSHRCICKPGYSGTRCEVCAPGYFGDPMSSIACQPCDCDMAGALSPNCAQDTGQCRCAPGIHGRRCDQCEPDHVVDAGRCIDCRGPCTGELFVKADGVMAQINNLNVTSLAYRGLARLGQQVDAVRARFSPAREQAERDLITRVQHVAKQTVQLREQVDQIQITSDAFQTTRCVTLGNGTELHQDIAKFRRRVLDWIQEVREAPTRRPDQATIQRWREEANRVLTELETINLNSTDEWLTQLLTGAEEAMETANALLKSVKPGKSATDLERLAAYQEEQERLLEFQQAQLFRIGNATQDTVRELNAAKTKSDKLEKAAKEAIDSAVMRAFENSVKKVDDQLDEWKMSGVQDIEQKLENAKSALKELNGVVLVELKDVRIPTTLRMQVVEPMEREADSILRLLRPNSRLNRTMEALEAYQTIVDNMQAAENATSEAEEALKQSTAGQDQTMMTEVAKKGSEIQTALDKQGDVLIERNKTLNEALRQLDEVSTDLTAIGQTASDSLSYSKETVEKVEKVKQVLETTEPLAQNTSDKSVTQRIKLDDLTDRLQQLENRYAQLQGTAQSMVDQANSTQTNLVKLVGDAESSAKQLDSKLLKLRRLADEARSMLDVTYGALAQDPVPMRLGKSCVYSLVPYSLTKSRVFDVEFWFKIHDIQMAMDSVIMVGRRAFAGRTQMFAFTLERPDPTLRFSWNVMGGKVEIGPIRQAVWYQVRVTSVLGETRMMLTERPEEDEVSTEPRTREAVTSAGADHPESALMLDRQMELRVGGVIQAGTRLVSPESWGDNAAEAFWARLLSMGSPELCIFNLRLGGMRMSIVDLATATPSCMRPKSLGCQIRLNYRPLVRDGYTWRPQGKLNQVTTRMRPAKESLPQYVLQRLFYYDFAGTGGYARLQSTNDLQFCKDHIQFQLIPLNEARNERMMGFTFFDYQKDFGVTVEWVNGRPKATRWSGNELYRSMHSSELLEADEAMRRRRVLRATTASSYAYFTSRWRRSVFSESGRDLIVEAISLQYPQQQVWRLDSLLASECHEDTILFVGAIPPGHYTLRRRMAELGLPLNPFKGRIGLSNDKLSQDGELYLDDYVALPVNQFGDSHFTDLRQRGESWVVSNTKPDSQYCLRLIPHDAYTQLELDHTKVDSPFNPGVSMTIRFNPLRAITEDINLLRVQVSSAEWFRIWLTSDHRLGILIPGGRKELITREPLSYRPLEDPSFALRDLELAEARMINASTSAWKELPKEGEEDKNSNSVTESIKSESWSPSGGEIEVAVTLHFGGADSRQLYVLYDQRVVQSWTIPKQMNDAKVQQILVGPHAKISQPITINYLVIGRKLVDFATDLTNAESRNGSQVGFCGGQLHPRFFERPGPVGPIWIAQGLDLAPPPGGRRLRFVDPGSPEANATLPGVSRPPGIKPTERLRREEDCAAKPESTAWFDKTATSYWELSNLGAHIRDSDTPFQFKIGFRAQLSRGTSGTVPSMSVLPSFQYSLLAAFNFGPDVDNLYLILSESQIFLTDNQRVLWSSPHLTIADTNWHQLVLTFPEDPANGNGGTGDNELNGPIVESGIHMLFDGRELWLPSFGFSPRPILALIGGLPAGQKLTLNPDENIAPVSGLFGCVDELEISGVQFDPKQSGRPACYDCFSLDPNLVHIPQSIEKYLDTTLIPLEIPSEFLQPDTPQITFDFSIFYDRQALPSASLFILSFEGEQNGDLVTHRIWLHLAEAEVKMSPAPYDEQLADYGHSAPLLSLPRYANTWQFIKLHMFFDFGNVVLQLQSQVGESLPMAIFNNANRLKAIHFARDSVITPQEQNSFVSGSKSHTFTGCIRDMRLTSGTNVQNVLLPSNIPGLLQGVCHTSLVW